MFEVMAVGLFRRILAFLAGGLCYMGLEFLWRGWSHEAMFLAGGTCFLLLGKLEKTRPRLPLLPRALMGALVITMVELLVGLIANQDYRIWDYRDLPGNFHGQICLPFFLLWMPLSLGAMWLYSTIRNIARRIYCRGHKDKWPSA